MKTTLPLKGLTTLRCLTATGALLLPTLAPAAEWIGTTGLFGDGANWDTGFEPIGEPANITNGGTAEIVTPNEFIIGTLTLGGVAGTGTLSISGGTLLVSGGGHNAYIGGSDSEGSTGVGHLNISGGSLVASGGEFLVGSRGGTGHLTMTGGTLSNDNWIIFGRDGGGTAIVNLSGGAEIVKTGGGNIAIGIFSGTTSTMTMSDSSSISSNSEIRVGWGNNGAATKGVLTMSGTADASAGGNFQVAFREGGGSGGPTGEMHMSGSSTANAGNEFYVGSAAGSNGTLTMNDDATINVTNGFVVGRFDSTGIATVNGNAEIAVGGFNVIGDGPPAVGTLIVNDNAHVHSGKQLWLGLNNSESTVTINGGLVSASATVSGDGGNHDATGAGVSFSRVVIGGMPEGGHGTLNLNGGTLETPGFSKYAGTAQINLNGGRIRATGMTTTGSFFDNIGDGEINIQAGGAVFDTNNNDIIVIQNLAGVGGLTKEGLGTLSLTGTPTYLGDTVILGGALSITTGFLADGSNVGLTTGTVFDLNFAGTDTINALFIDGVAQAVGTWGSATSTADHKSDLFTGTGVLVVTSAVPEPSTLALFGIAAFGGWILRRRKTGQRV